MKYTVFGNIRKEYANYITFYKIYQGVQPKIIEFAIKILLYKYKTFHNKGLNLEVLHPSTGKQAKRCTIAENHMMTLSGF